MKIEKPFKEIKQYKWNGQIFYSHFMFSAWCLKKKVQTGYEYDIKKLFFKHYIL